MVTNTSQRTRGVLSILAAALIWSTIPMALDQIDGAPIIKVFFRCFFALVAVTAYMVATGRLGLIRQVERPVLRQLVIQGVVLALNWVLFLFAFEYANVAVVELFGYLGPAIVPIMASLTIGEQFDRRIIPPLLFSLTGIAIIMAGHGLSFTPTESLGAGLALASSLTYALLTVRSKQFVSQVPTDVIIWTNYVVSSAVLAIPMALAYLAGNSPTGGLSDYGLLIMLGFFHTAFAIALFLYGLKRMRADQGAALTYAEPASAVVIAAIFMGQPLGPATVIGGLLVIVGGTIVARMEAAHGIEITPIEATVSECEGDCPESST